jgi:hypothetical protein
MQAPLKDAENKQPAALAWANFSSSHAAQLSHNVTKANQCEQSTQHTTTSKGGHTNDRPCIISEGPGANTKSSPQKLVTRRFLEHGNCLPENCIGHQSLEESTFCQGISTPSYGSGNGVHGTHKRPRPPTSLEKRLW